MLLMLQKLCEWLGPSLPRERTISTEKKLLATVWLLANKESFRGVADRFGIHKGTLYNVVMLVCRVISEKRSDVIIWPVSSAQLQVNAEKFYSRCGMAGVVGAIDGTHIPIPGPQDHRESYINRKGIPSMQLQVVCNADLLFIDVLTGWPGSVHDARVFRNSALKTALDEGELPHRYHLLGDSAYPLSVSLLVPFRDNGHLTAIEKKFNKAHASTRVEVERAIGLLKGKFRRLKYLEMLNVDSMPYLIFAACALHNFIILDNGVDEEDIDLQAERDAEDEAVDNNMNNMPCAIDKRLEIAHLLI